MAKKRARLTDDNDPLSSTDEVLAGFQQLSQSTSQPVGKSAIQEVETSQEVEPPVREDAVNKLTGLEVELRGGQEEQKQQVNQLTIRKVKKSTSQLVELSTEGAAEMTSQQDNNKASQKDEKLAKQQVNKSKLRKVTFQIQESVVNSLDKLHLQLQLELGKANAPYKEVIVEEAISRLLEEAESNRDELVEVLRQRQEQRK